MTLLADHVAGRRGADGEPPPDFDLARLLAPVSPRVFHEEYWERRPLHIARNDPGHYASLLTLADLDRVLARTSVREDDLRVVLDGRETPVSEIVGRGENSRRQALDALYGRFREGATIILNAFENRWEPLWRLCRTLGAEAGARFQVNVYVTPAGNRGFVPHHDTHDVYVAQAHGSKRWQLFGAPLELPLPSQPHDKSKPPPTVPEREVEMRPGDLLYLPRGTLHAATANEGISVHLTIGCHPVRGSTIVEDAVRRLVEQDVEFRRGVPLGFGDGAVPRRELEAHFARLVATLGAGLSPAAMADAALSRARSTIAPSLAGHLVDLEHAAEIGLHTRVQIGRAHV